MGVCNPTGEDDTYNGLYMTETELREIVRDNKMRNLPVKTEHAGSEVGHVVTSFLDASGNLHCVMQLSTSSIPGALAQGFVRDRLRVHGRHTEHGQQAAGEAEEDRRGVARAQGRAPRVPHHGVPGGGPAGCVPAERRVGRVRPVLMCSVLS